ncbi:uncharacterized protein LOC111920260 [Lactuca sativa]|uniref:uncharacterized protein LOC111920260 n=1 Tax=Lactuca sativa TaxID=4236 RepID=UPI000CD85BB1|nr:uncharacterized protein LOC111920260 [Lactuca sativa]
MNTNKMFTSSKGIYGQPLRRYKPIRHHHGYIWTTIKEIQAHKTSSWLLWPGQTMVLQIAFLMSRCSKRLRSDGFSSKTNHSCETYSRFAKLVVEVENPKGELMGDGKNQSFTPNAHNIEARFLDKEI